MQVEGKTVNHRPLSAKRRAGCIQNPTHPTLKSNTVALEALQKRSCCCQLEQQRQTHGRSNCCDLTATAGEQLRLAAVAGEWHRSQARQA
eukprot:366402-Chlamydomonas_euryale.AAC.16